jgi:DNA-binding MurR/RpiR family transcriptional regulator
MVDLIARKLNSLSPGQQKVARYIMDNLEKASYETIAQIGRENCVSETTVIRLSYALGFGGFSEMQKGIRASILEPHENGNAGESTECGYAGEENPLESEIKNLQKMSGQLDYAALDKAAEILCAAKNVFCVGHRTSAYSAGWFAFVLEILRGNTRLVPGSQETYALLDTNEDSVVVCIAFSRYSTETINFADMAKEKKAAIIAVTDSPFSPLARLADYSFIAPPNRTKYGFNSIASTCSLLNLLIEGVSKRYPQAEERIQEQEHIYSINRIIFE